MGIRGLTAILADLRKPHNRRYFEGSDIYIDTLNYAHYTPSESPSPNEALNRVKGRIKRLKSLKPNSLTFVSDAMIGEEKFLVRKSRSVAKENRPSSKKSCFDEFAQVITNDKDVNHVYAGTEAEDEIMKLIDEDKKRGSRLQLVVSGDSDLYRFDIRNAKYVEIINMSEFSGLFKGAKGVKNAFSLNLGDIIDSGRVPKKLVVGSPIIRPGISFLNPPKPCRNYLELVNCGIIYNRLFVQHSDPTEQLIQEVGIKGFDPFDIGIVFRRALYALVIRNYFQSKPDFESRFVEEWSVGAQIQSTRKIKPLEPEYVDDFIALLRNSTLESILKNQLEFLAKKYEFMDDNVSYMVHYVEQIARKGPRQTGHFGPVNERRLKLLHKLVQTIIKRLLTLEQAIEGEFFEGQDYLLSIGNLRRRLSPNEFQEFANARSPNA